MASSVVPLPNNEHLRLGMTRQAMIAFVKERLLFPETYRRDEEKLGWVTRAFGPVDYTPIKVDWRGVDRARNLTGYDLAEAIRAWLPTIGADSLSVCEVLAAEGWEYDAVEYNGAGKEVVRRAKGVGKANVFFSHMQRPCAVSVAFRNLWSAHNTFDSVLPAEEDTYFWVDYFVLRQCQRDFNVEAIRSVVNEIGCTLAELDSRMRYLTRSFCVFEVFCTTERSDAKLLVLTEMESERMQRALESTPVNSAMAQTWRDEDKQMIDAFICDVFGTSEAFDRRVTDALVAGSEAWDNVDEAPPTDDWGNWSKPRSHTTSQPTCKGREDNSEQK